ncbi:MAG: hypothetical protein H6732_09925 [Alphaproteobacteria bacterium]|nr:hypothetical protein [Alphaproteobacteria bacterium]
MARTRGLERLTLVLLAVGLGWQTFTVWKVRGHARALEARVVDAELRLESLELTRTLQMSAPPPELFAPAGGGDGAVELGDPLGARGAVGPRGGRRQAARGAAPSEATTTARAAARAAFDQQAEQVPGAKVLSMLYDAADAVAAEEGWDDETYDGVTRVFDRAMTAMTRLGEQVQEGELDVPEAKRRAIRMRDAAAGELLELLGDESFVRLREAVVDELPAGRR